MRWAFSFALNRLFVLAAIALLLNNMFRNSCSVGNPYVEMLNQWLGVDELVRAFEHGL
jgi:hypothetical protein